MPRNKITPAEKLKAEQLKLFAAHYAVHFNGAAAYKHAGFEGAAGSASELARRILANPEVQQLIKDEIGELGELHFRLHEENTARLIAMRDADRASIFNPQGDLLDIADWPEDVKLLIAGVEIEELWEGQGKDRRPIGTVKKVKLEAPRAIVDSLAKISGQWVERAQWLGKDGKPADPGNVAPIINVTVSK